MFDKVSVLPCTRPSRDRMEYEPFLGEEEAEEEDIFSIGNEAARRHRAKRRRLLAFGVAGSIAVLAFLIVGLVYASRADSVYTSPGEAQHAVADGGSSQDISADSSQNANGDSSQNAQGDQIAAAEEPPDPKPSPEVHKFKSAAVAADSTLCSSVGRELLEKGGNAVDAAIGSLACLGLTDPQSMGIGGGFFMTIYNATTGRGTAIDARETAPENATVDMYDGDRELAGSGPLSIAVPAEVKGYWYTHQKYGSLPWPTLLEPAIKMARDGFRVSFGLHHAIQDDEELLSTEPSLREVFFNEKTGKVFRYQEVMRRPKLAETLKIIAEEGLGSLDRSTLMRNVMADLEEIGAIVTKRDIVDYKVLEKDPIEISLDGSMRVLSPPPPSSGAVLSFMLNIMEGYNLKPLDIASLEAKVLTYHRIIESFKFAYAKRTALGDEDFVDVRELVANLTSKAYADSIRHLITDNSTHDYRYYGPSFYTPKTSGTSQLSILDQDGNAVSVTSTINGRFGARLRGRRTGIIWNNEMDDFSAPNITNEYGLLPSEANFIKPGKRPLSSMCPAIIVESDGEREGGGRHTGHVRQVIGAAGGSLITSTTAWISQHNLWLGKSIKEAVDLYRIHHQLLPPEVQYEEGTDELVLRGLRLKGHELLSFGLGKSISQGIEVKDGWIFASSDYRKGGAPDGF